MLGYISSVATVFCMLGLTKAKLTKAKLTKAKLTKARTKLHKIDGGGGREDRGDAIPKTQDSNDGRKKRAREWTES